MKKYIKERVREAIEDASHQQLAAASGESPVVDQIVHSLLGIASEEAKHRLERQQQQENDENRESNTLQSNNDSLDSSSSNMDIENDLPTSSSSSSIIRETPLFKLALRSLKWQRDNYLIGPDYANERRRGRQSPQALLFQPGSISPSSTTLGLLHLVKLATWFIPSSTMHSATLPIVLPLPFGPLYDPIVNATLGLGPMSQNNLNEIVKGQVLTVFQSDFWRDLTKASTRGAITRTYRDLR